MESILAGIVVALVTAYATSRFYAHRVKAELKGEFESRFNERKWDAYMGFADTVREVLEHTSEGNLQKHQAKLMKRLFDFMGKLWLVGSDDVVEAVVTWRNAGSRYQEGSGDPPVLIGLAEILIAMRRDLGNEDTSLSAVKILSTFINDIETVIAGRTVAGQVPDGSST